MWPLGEVSGEWPIGARSDSASSLRHGGAELGPERRNDVRIL